MILIASTMSVPGHEPMPVVRIGGSSPEVGDHEVAEMVALPTTRVPS